MNISRQELQAEARRLDTLVERSPVVELLPFILQHLQSCQCLPSSSFHKDCLPSAAILSFLAHLDEPSMPGTQVHQLLGTLTVISPHLPVPVKKAIIDALCEHCLPHQLYPYLLNLTNNKLLSELLHQWFSHIVSSQQQDDNGVTKYERVQDDAEPNRVKEDAVSDAFLLLTHSLLLSLRRQKQVSSSTQHSAIFEAIIDNATHLDNPCLLALTDELAASLTLNITPKPSVQEKRITLKHFAYVQCYSSLSLDNDSISYADILECMAKHDKDLSLRSLAIRALVDTKQWRRALPVILILLQTRCTNKTSTEAIITLLTETIETNPFRREYTLQATVAMAFADIATELHSLLHDFDLTPEISEVIAFLEDERYFVTMCIQRLLPAVLAVTQVLTQKTLKSITQILGSLVLPCSVQMLMAAMQREALQSDMKAVIQGVLYQRCSTIDAAIALCTDVHQELQTQPPMRPWMLTDCNSYPLVDAFLRIMDPKLVDNIHSQLYVCSISALSPALQRSVLVLMVALSSSKQKPVAPPSTIQQVLDTITAHFQSKKEDEGLPLEEVVMTALGLYLLAMHTQQLSQEARDDLHRLLPTLLLMPPLMHPAIALSLRMHQSEIPLLKSICMLQETIFQAESTDTTLVVCYLAVLRLSIQENALVLRENWQKTLEQQQVQEQALSILPADEHAEDYLAQVKKNEQAREWLESQLENAVISGFFACYLDFLLEMIRDEQTAVVIRAAALETLAEYCLHSDQLLQDHLQLFEETIAEGEQLMRLRALSSWIDTYNPNISHPHTLPRALLSILDLPLNTFDDQEPTGVPPEVPSFGSALDNSAMVDSLIEAMARLIRGQQLKDPMHYLCSIAISSTCPRHHEYALQCLNDILLKHPAYISRILLKLVTLQQLPPDVLAAALHTLVVTFIDELELLDQQSIAALEVAVTQELVRTGDGNVQALLSLLQPTQQSSLVIQNAQLNLLPKMVQIFLRSRVTVTVPGSDMGSPLPVAAQAKEKRPAKVKAASEAKKPRSKKRKADVSRDDEEY